MVRPGFADFILKFAVWFLLLGRNAARADMARLLFCGV